MAEGGDDAIGDDWLEILRDVGEGIEADRPIEIGGIDVDQVIGPRAGDMVKRGPSEVAVGIEESEAFAGGEVLADQVEEKRALAGAGLADDVEVAAALVWCEHDRIAQNGVGTDAKLLVVCGHSRKGAGVPCAPQFGRWCWQHPVSCKVRRGYMASSPLCVMA
jgi:hypothetical protein